MPDDDFNAVPLKAYVDGQLTEIRRATDLALASMAGEAVPLRQYFEAILDEQRRGMVVAEQEREKAANALRLELARAIEEGDRALREHIHQQVAQIRQALESAELLEIERIAAANARTDALKREIQLSFEASEKAISKADVNTEKRFDAVNAFREQLASQSSSFMLREVADAQFAELRQTIQSAIDRLNKLV